MHTHWQLVGVTPETDPPQYEYWRSGDEVYRRRRLRAGVPMPSPDGTPIGARWEGSADWFARWYSVTAGVVTLRNTTDAKA